MAETKKRVYRFGGKTAEGDGSMRELLGGKGANLAEMSKLGMPVPAGFTITTECCAEYYALGGGYSEELKAEVAEALAATEKLMGKKFGDTKDPPGKLPFRCEKQYAWYDGHHPQHRSLLRNSSGND